jgi:hypothetical protein
VGVFLRLGPSSPVGSSPERGAPGIFFQTQPDGPNQRAAGLDELESPARPWEK